MKADVTWKTSIDDATVIIEALHDMRRALFFGADATAATEEEKLHFMGKLLQVESILRQLNSPLPKLESNKISWGPERVLQEREKIAREHPEL